MKYYSQSHCKWAMFLIVLSLPRVDSANQFSPAGRRIRRQINACQDGNYTVNGKTCCLCAAGQLLTKECEVNPEDRDCEFCEPGRTYNNKPNSETFCEQCTSCTQPNANLEVKEECTTAKDTACRCKQGYFCLSEPCISCNPCNKSRCEELGVKNSCTGTKDTVCKERSEVPAAILPVAIIFGIVLAAAVGFAFAFAAWKMKWCCFKTSNVGFEGTDGKYVESSSLALLEDAYLDKDGNFSKLIPDIASLVGWGDMRNIAMADGFKKTILDNIQQNNPKQAEEQTISLLTEWEEKHGREAARMLMKALLKNNKNSKAQALQGIIRSDRSNKPASATP
ncbi:tumor necrosis factor receptor superfamily member 6 isoform X1 [Gadus morhua]|uniref:tumor necrosis factor receptor superfamily member 6 isoform X1 n=1 Tax=Gadus morhua TaxID=8049 RepID=UPI0011B5EDC6|nr:tumor necrosis factor receptor superfamily member 6-like isoform X1 [Gadus morhua]